MFTSSFVTRICDKIDAFAFSALDRFENSTLVEKANDFIESRPRLLAACNNVREWIDTHERAFLTIAAGACIMAAVCASMLVVDWLFF